MELPLRDPSLHESPGFLVAGKFPRVDLEVESPSTADLDLRATQKFGEAKQESSGVACGLETVADDSHNPLSLLRETNRLEGRM
jgi:hypothetical protein